MGKFALTWLQYFARLRSGVVHHVQPAASPTQRRSQTVYMLMKSTTLAETPMLQPQPIWMVPVSANAVVNGLLSRRYYLYGLVSMACRLGAYRRYGSRSQVFFQSVP